MTNKSSKNNSFSEKEYFQHLLNLTPSSVYWKDVNGIYLGCNLAMLKMVGVSFFEEIIGKGDRDLSWKKSAVSLRDNDQKVMAEGKLLRFEETGRLSDGNIQTVISNKMPLTDKSGKIIGVIGSSIDITELKYAQKAMQTASDAKTEFLENMRHDIRTPLTGIVGCAQILHSEAKDPKVAECTSDLVQSSNALLDFLNQVLESMQVATGEIPLLKRKFNLRKQLEEIINLNKSFANKKALSLNLNYDEMIPVYLIGDPVRVQRIVLELITNALTFTEKGEVSLTVKLKKSKSARIVIELTVRDTGMGIPPDKQDEIFLRFKRLTSSYQGIYKGLGLGLTIVKQFIDDLAGEIYVTSRSPDKGAIFTCFIPFQEPLVLEDVGMDELHYHGS